MRVGRIILALMLPLIVACKILPSGLAQQTPSPSSQDGIAETALADGDGKSAGAGVRPKPRPTRVAQDDEAAVTPIIDAPPPSEVAPIDTVVQKSKEQITCEKRGGNWGSAGISSLKTCIKRTKDAGKQCRKQGDCSSVCLARSGTCAPVKPLFGCNEIFQKDGSRVTLCID
jgi:hypothetical protein